MTLCVYQQQREKLLQVWGMMLQAWGMMLQALEMVQIQLLPPEEERTL